MDCHSPAWEGMNYLPHNLANDRKGCTSDWTTIFSDWGGITGLSRLPRSTCATNWYCQLSGLHKGAMDDHQLVNGCLKGKPAAQRELYARFSESMLGVCYRYTKSVRDAEDVLQEGFIKVFMRLSQFKYEGELGAWIRRIMVTTALNYLKRNQKYRDEMYFEDQPLHPVTTDNPVILLEAKQLADLIRQLPAGYQSIFNLHAVEGYSHVEIGEMLGIADSTSRSQYARARTLLIDWIENLSLENKKESYAGK